MNRSSAYDLEIIKCYFVFFTTQMLQSRRKKILDLYARTCNVTEGESVTQRKFLILPKLVFRNFQEKINSFYVLCCSEKLY